MGKAIQGDIAFWGEWEPESYFLIVKDSQENMPQHIHRPFHTNYEKDNLQNTDPYIYGDTFLYSCCQQNINRKAARFKQRGIFPSTLQELDVGSLILFGSSIGKDQSTYEFVLDTVFVVSGFKEYRLDNISELEPLVPPTFYKCVLSKIEDDSFSEDVNAVYCTHYFGSTYFNILRAHTVFLFASPLLLKRKVYFLD